MSGKTDDLIKAWLLERFLWSGRYDKVKHGTIKSIEVLKVDAAWDCGCYSEFTRDDTFRLEGLFKSSSGTWYWEYGTWGDLPRFIEELEEYDKRGSCPYEEDD